MSYVPTTGPIRQHRTAITGASLKIYVRSLRQIANFWGRLIEWCHPNLPQTDPCWQYVVFLLFEEHKIGCNSACIYRGSPTSPPILAPNMVFSGSANLTVYRPKWNLIVSDEPLLPWQRKFAVAYLESEKRARATLYRLTFRCSLHFHPCWSVWYISIIFSH